MRSRQLATITAFSMHSSNDDNTDRDDDDDVDAGSASNSDVDVDEKDAQDESWLSSTSCQQPLDTSVVT